MSAIGTHKTAGEKWPATSTGKVPDVVLSPKLCFVLNYSIRERPLFCTRARPSTGIFLEACGVML